jgi:K+-sensing histidine kinase KdpD
MSDSLKAEILAPIADGQVLESSHRTGLGLSFCKMVIEAHQGQIFVQDNTPQGSIVTLVLEQPKNLNPED